MKVCFRVDSSSLIGTGHVMRCLTLAEWLKKNDCEIGFICRELPGNLCHLVELRGFKLQRLPHDGTIHGSENVNKKKNNFHSDWLSVSWQNDAEQSANLLRSESPIDWVIVDHYAIDEKWEKIMRSHAKKVMVIDDLADRRHDCDLLLDQNLYHDTATRYDNLVPAHCKKLLGPTYALLRPEFIQARKKIRARGGNVNRVLIFFGGSDPTNETTKTLESFALLNRPEIVLDVVVGGTNEHRDQIKQICYKRPNTNFNCQVDNMAELMVLADLAIGAGGATTWERCFLGLPAIILITAHNQQETSAAVAEAGAVWNLGLCQQVDAKQLAKTIEHFLQCPSDLTAMTDSALRIMRTGTGVSSVSGEILEY